MSSLNSIILEIEKEAEIKKEELIKKHRLELEKMQRENQKEIAFLEKEMNEEIEKEKKKTIENYKGKKEFEHKMNVLSLKESLIREAVSMAKEKIRGYSFEERKVFYLKKIKELTNFSLSGKVFVPEGKSLEIRNLFQDNIEVIEKPLKTEDGFIVEGEKFSFEVSISSVIDEIVLKNKNILLSLFK